MFTVNDFIDRHQELIEKHLSNNPFPITGFEDSLVVTISHDEYIDVCQDLGKRKCTHLLQNERYICGIHFNIDLPRN